LNARSDITVLRCLALTVKPYGDKRAQMRPLSTVISRLHSKRLTAESTCLAEFYCSSEVRRNRQPRDDLLAGSGWGRRGSV